MSRFLFLILVLPLLAGLAFAQLPSLTNPNPGCPLCMDSPPAGTFSERHYQRQQRTPSYSAPSVPSYDYGYTPGQNRYNHSLNDQAYRDPSMGRGADYWWPTPEQQMQQESLAIQEYNAGYGRQNRRQSKCNSWTLDGC